MCSQHHASCNDQTQTFKKTKSDYSKGELMKRIVKSHYFTVSQLAVIVGTSGSDYTKGQIVGDAAARVVDPKNAFWLKNSSKSSYTANQMVKAVTKSAKGFRK